MHLCNETITVFNTTLDKDTGYDMYVGTVITGASWHCSVESTIDSSGGLKAASKFTIRIPTDADFSGKTYVDPVAYAAADASEAFTLRSGDIIVKGAVEGADITPATLQAGYYETLTVLAVTDNRRAKAAHWKVVGA